MIGFFRKIAWSVLGIKHEYDRYDRLTTRLYALDAKIEKFEASILGRTFAPKRVDDALEDHGARLALLEQLAEVIKQDHEQLDWTITVAGALEIELTKLKIATAELYAAHKFKPSRKRTAAKSKRK